MNPRRVNPRRGSWQAVALPPLALALVCASGVTGCRDLARFGNAGDHYEGDVVQGSFVRAGFEADAHLCIVLDADHLQDAPGTVSSSDGRFSGTPLRPIPQIWHDPLSTISFGEGRVKNLLYVATPSVDGAADADVMIFVSLMQSGSLEVRLVRGAPAIDAGTDGASLFGVFALSRAGGSCSF